MLSYFVAGQKADQTNSWMVYTGNHKMSSSLGIHTEVQVRRSDFLNEWMQLLLRVGCDYSISKNALISAGFAYVDTWPYGKFAEEANPKYNHYRFIEHRAWEQFITKQQLGRFYMQNRFRLEQRWIESKTLDISVNEYVRDKFLYRNRARFRYMVQVPINKKELSENTFFFQFSDEIFINFGPNIKMNIFDQNRLYGGFGWQFKPGFNVQLGYLNQFIEKSDGTHKENNHTLQVAVNYNLDFTKLKS